MPSSSTFTMLHKNTDIVALIPRGLKKLLKNLLYFNCWYNASVGTCVSELLLNGPVRIKFSVLIE